MNLKDYFYNRLGPDDNARIQQMICEKAGSEELDLAMRELFDECERASATETGAKRKNSVLRRGVPYLISAAAVIAFVVCQPIIFKKGQQMGEERIAAIEWKEEFVPAGEKKTISLADGTVLHLNAGSRLTYPKEFSGNVRTVFLSGEAFAQVRKDPEHPFIINSGDIKVTVLGTTFNFKNYPESHNAEVLLMDGSIKASVRTKEQDREVKMSPGDKLHYDRVSGKIDLSNFSPQRYKAFYEDNSMHFFDVEMIDIAKELSRTFNRQIVVQDQNLASRRYFAIFTNNETLDEVLDAMNADGKMNIRRQNGIIYLSSR